MPRDSKPLPTQLSGSYDPIPVLWGPQGRWVAWHSPPSCSDFLGAPQRQEFMGIRRKRQDSDKSEVPKG